MNGQTIVLVDGVETAVLDVHDRGLMYGDGVFRTLRVVDGRPRWWQEHLDKLAADCAGIAISPPATALWQADFDHLAGRFASQPGAGSLKLVVTRGSGPRGYLPPAAGSPRRIMLYAPVTPHPGDYAEGVRVRLCRFRLGHQPALAGIKHLNRLENVLARSEWNDPEIKEGLMLDQEANVISGVMSNLFIWRRNRLLTPRLDRCGVAGVTRARVMRLAAAAGMEVVEQPLTLSDVRDADEAMLSNSLIGLWRVARLDDHIWPMPVISPRLAVMIDA